MALNPRKRKLKVLYIKIVYRTILTNIPFLIHREHCRGVAITKLTPKSRMLVESSTAYCRILVLHINEGEEIDVKRHFQRLNIDSEPPDPEVKSLPLEHDATHNGLVCGLRGEGLWVKCRRWK